MDFDMMGRLEDLRHFLNGGVSNNKNNNRRPLNNNDYAAFDEALDVRNMAPSKPQTLEEARRRVRKQNPVMWWLIKRDYAWLKRQMKLLGLNPEDARFLL